MDLFKVLAFLLLTLSIVVAPVDAMAKTDTLTDAHGNLSPKKILCILYTVSAGEGFNLHRDVYMRAATMVHQLRQTHPELDARLLLLSWLRMPHWRRTPLSMQQRWSTFFDIVALNKYVPVNEIAADKKTITLIDVIYELLPMAKDGGWDFAHAEGYKIVACPPAVTERYENITIKLPDNSLDRRIESRHFGSALQARRLECVAVQGKAAVLESLLLEQTNGSLVMLASFERMLHNHYGSPDYWNCRRSMRYASKLVEAAGKFRSLLLIDDAVESSLLPAATTSGEASFTALHVRRRDFAVHHRGGTLDDICQQTMALLRVHDKNLVSGVDKIYVASDELDVVLNSLRACNFQQNRMPRLVSLMDAIGSVAGFSELSEGELAVIDQIVAARARLFIGTCDSTFTLRIQEDREIFGHASNTTFNCFCNKKEQTTREDYGKWTDSGPCYIKRPWRVAQNDEDYFRIAFDHTPYVRVNDSLRVEKDENARRADDEL